MAATGKEDRGWSGCESKKMEGDDGSRTLECLRGRLLAERQASKIAKEEAELLGNKLMELENKLKEETKLRKKAEKKHGFLMKKLETLKIFPTLEGSEQSISSENSGSSCISSISSSSHKDPEESESKPQTRIPADSQDTKEHSVSETTTSNRNLCPIITIEESSGTQDSDSAHNLKACSLNKSSQESTACSQDLKADDEQSSPSIKASLVEMRKIIGNESDNVDYVDNSLALVPVAMSSPASTQKSELKLVNRNVSEVLETLKLAREQIKSSVERRHIIRVGPT